jgi:hypothetical protein
MSQASHVLLGIHDVYNKEFCHGDLPSSGIVALENLVVSCACLPFLFMLSALSLKRLSILFHCFFLPFCT